MKVTYKHPLLLLSVISISMMLIMDYDSDYGLTILLPVVYFVFTLFYFQEGWLNYGPCSKSLMLFYGFRMCILPVICAYGNFWIEADKSQIIRYYNLGILYMCIEFLIVIMSLFYYNRKTEKGDFFLSSDKQSLNIHSFFVKVVMILTILFVTLFVLVGSDYFHLITGEMDELLLGEEPEEHHGLWYLEDFICTIIRPLLSFLIVGRCLVKRNLINYLFVFVVILFNFIFVSDRRIFSILISGICIYYLILTTRNKKFRMILNMSIVVGIIFGIYVFLFFQFNSGAEILSRTVQHYFSGPSLNAIALAANAKIDYSIMNFFNMLWNCSFFLCSVFSSMPVDDGYDELFGFGVWTPMFMDCVRYFGVLSFLFPIIFVRFIVNCDTQIRRNNEIVFKMTYLFLGVVTSCYLIMYTLHLIIYFLLSANIIYRYLMGDLFNSKFSKQKQCIRNRGTKRLSAKESDHILVKGLKTI